MQKGCVCVFPCTHNTLTVASDLYFHTPPFIQMWALTLGFKTSHCSIHKVLSFLASISSYQ